MSTAGCQPDVQTAEKHSSCCYSRSQISKRAAEGWRRPNLNQPGLWGADHAAETAGFTSWHPMGALMCTLWHKGGTSAEYIKFIKFAWKWGFLKQPVGSYIVCFAVQNSHGGNIETPTVNRTGFSGTWIFLAQVANKTKPWLPIKSLGVNYTERSNAFSNINACLCYQITTTLLNSTQNTIISISAHITMWLHSCARGGQGSGCLFPNQYLKY